ncbi:hypothetical protein NKW53_00845 [Acetobacter orientalis]|uniref:hypothetical protein n=1 Tax=Acetobacter orientalis TaxID=146474 RepID=UPI00209EB45D|nr:hypothetical protein [Acetobacter orientalis]MCP1214615.1 hypothetical protein [Acetobacter orientalis]MCP1218197.1 hypothetical protein [Acetobacter orientalis]
MTANEFAALAPQKIGQVVTVDSCFASNASTAGVDCVSFGPQQAHDDLNWNVLIPVDGNTIDRQSLLRALNNCADLNHRTDCRVSVTGTVRDAMADMGINDTHMYVLKAATLKWLN